MSRKKEHPNSKKILIIIFLSCFIFLSLFFWIFIEFINSFDKTNFYSENGPLSNEEIKQILTSTQVMSYWLRENLGKEVNVSIMPVEEYLQMFSKLENISLVCGSNANQTEGRGVLVFVENDYIVFIDTYSGKILCDFVSEEKKKSFILGVLKKFTSDSTTSLWKKESWKNYEGMYVEGTAYVDSVDENLLGKYVILASLNRKGVYDIGSDYALFFENFNKEKLLQLNKGQKISFGCLLKNYHDILGNIDLNSCRLL